ncbi:MAG TPA: lipoyl synthase [Acidimicrobiales bacterium]|nr:lipoyl synthase [Acidimicrobiales bacterium]
MTPGGPLRVRWLGRVRYEEASVLQHALWRGGGDYLLLLEHPHVYTLGVRARPEHVLPGAAASGAELVRTDRGGDVTYHGPGQLVGYPVVDVPLGPGAIPAHVHRIEQLVIDVLADLGLPGASRLEGYPGVWVDASGPSPRKICAIGVRVARGRSMHGFALNVDPDMAMFSHIVPCGIADKPVTSLEAEGVQVSMAEVVERVAARAADLVAAPGSPPRAVERQSASPATPAPAGPAGSVPKWAAAGAGAPVELRPLGRRLAASGVDLGRTVPIRERKPEYLRAPVRIGRQAIAMRSMLRELGLVTVCEEAGCPNLSECWADGTATFMINGERCTRACGFCLVDTGHPLPLDPAEPEHVAEAVARLGLAHAVVTAVARDDLPDGGAAAFARTIEAIRRRSPGTAVEVLIPDCKGEEGALATIFDARPDVLNHNVETVLRLQRAVRPSAAYHRSLAVLARASEAGLVTKSGLVLGMGETEEEVLGALADLRAVGVDIVTIGQYLRPSSRHLPVVRWWRPEELSSLAEAGMAMGFAHVEASPLTRSSYHAREAAAAGRARGDTAVVAGSAS